MSLELKNEDYADIIKTQMETIRRQQATIDRLVEKIDEIVRHAKTSEDIDKIRNNELRDISSFIRSFTRSVVSYNPYSNTYEINKQFDPENKGGEKECQE